MENSMSQEDNKSKTESVPAIIWKKARPQPRVRPQWNPVELANQLLDEMERGGRLERSKKRA